MVGTADWSKGRHIYPSVLPTSHVIGMYAKTCKTFVESAISAIILCVKRGNDWRGISVSLAPCLVIIESAPASERSMININFTVTMNATNSIRRGWPVPPTWQSQFFVRSVAPLWHSLPPGAINYMHPHSRNCMHSTMCECICWFALPSFVSGFILKPQVSVLRLRKRELGAITQQGQSRPNLPGHEKFFVPRIEEQLTIRFQVASWCATDISKFLRNPRLMNSLLSKNWLRALNPGPRWLAY